MTRTTNKTPKPAGVTRRGFLNSAAAGAFVAAAPLYVRRANAASSELNILSWSAELPDDVLSDFQAETGITVNLTPFSSNEELINKMQATFGEGFDLCMPSFNRAPEFEFLELLAPFDTTRLAMDNYVPSLLDASEELWTWGGELYHVPHVWGSEAIAWRNDQADLSYADMSYGLLWEGDFAGAVQMRPTSGLLGLGLWLDATGKLPSNRMLDAYKDEATMRKIYDELLAYAVAHKERIKQFWDSTDTTRSGFMQNGCTIGQTWDGPALGLAKAGEPVSYMAPQEGALAWIDGFALPKAARNVDEVYAFFDYLLKPEIAGRVASGSSYNSSVKGADAYVPEADKELFRAAYPEDALDKLWRYPASPSWFNTVRNEYAEKFKVA
ncbi:extracellular solute-binding protein [Salipiger abyssi]|uniref:Spermidine/putrescine transport system substrate-binding protein n=1 Tax=Salipiger abyssi TaxID=1250539 RepID=A0A1P8US20_9RHOB|nr:extracellular solute-binding protein [Salipiger abyssi]APZ52205.1 spermidine/putrescine transport system substrate-binding protein [Salipiger abyssi]